MPIYEYTCHDCRRRVSLLWRSFAEAESRPPICPRCGSAHLTRLVSKVAPVRSKEGRLDALSDPGEMSDLDDDSPRSLARFMRKMAEESGEGLDPELDEMVSRLEAGEDPESIDRTMPDPGVGDDFGVM